MAKLAFRADLKLAPATLSALESAVAASREDGLRAYLGASEIGGPCDRALWYRFRWASRAEFEPRMLRLFARGAREEDTMAALLTAAGVQVERTDPATGGQYRFGDGHFGGSMDGAVNNLPDAPRTWHVWECKTTNAERFRTLAARGVEEAEPKHYAQMQCYMGWSGMERALYTAVCKDDDRLHFERIDFNRAEFDRLVARAQRIIEAPEPPPRVSEKPDWYVCKVCTFAAECHGHAVPLPTCRSCAHVTPTPGGEWHCERNNRALAYAAQLAGCQGHRYIPALLANFAEPIDADTEGNRIDYRNKLTDSRFANGLPPEGLESVEIHAAQDKRILGDTGAQELREVFDARITA